MACIKSFCYLFWSWHLTENKRCGTWAFRPRSLPIKRNSLSAKGRETFAPLSAMRDVPTRRPSPRVKSHEAMTTQKKPLPSPRGEGARRRRAGEGTLPFRISPGWRTAFRARAPTLLLTYIGYLIAYHIATRLSNSAIAPLCERRRSNRSADLFYRSAAFHACPLVKFQAAPVSGCLATSMGRLP